MAPKKKTNKLRAVQLQQTIKLKLEVIEHQKQNIFDLVEAFVDQLRTDTEVASKEDNVCYLSVTEKLDQASKTLDYLANIIIENASFDDSNSIDSPDVEVEDFEDEIQGKARHNKGSTSEDDKGKDETIPDVQISGKKNLSLEKSEDDVTVFFQQTESQREETSLPVSVSSFPTSSVIFENAESSSQNAPEQKQSLSHNTKAPSYQGLSSDLTSPLEFEVEPQHLPPYSSDLPLYSHNLPPYSRNVPLHLAYAQDQISSVSEPLVSSMMESPYEYEVPLSFASNISMQLQDLGQPPPQVQNTWQNFQGPHLYPPDVNSLQSMQVAEVFNPQNAPLLPSACPTIRPPGSIPLYGNQYCNPYPRQPFFHPVSRAEALPFVPDHSVPITDSKGVIYHVVPDASNSVSFNTFPSSSYSQASCVIGDRNPVHGIDTGNTPPSTTDTFTQSQLPTVALPVPSHSIPTIHQTVSLPVATGIPTSIPSSDSVRFQDSVSDSYSNPNVYALSNGVVDGTFHSQSQFTSHDVNSKAEDGKSDSQPKLSQFFGDEEEACVDDKEEACLQQLLKKLNTSLAEESHETDKKRDMESLVSNKQLTDSADKSSLDTDSIRSQEVKKQHEPELLSSHMSSEISLDGRRQHSASQHINVDVLTTHRSKKTTLKNSPHKTHNHFHENSWNFKDDEEESSKSVHRNYEAVSAKSVETDNIDDTMSCLSFGSMTRLVEEQTEISPLKSSSHSTGKSTVSPPQLASVKGTILAGKVVNVKHPWSFYVQLSGKIEEIQKRIEEIMIQHSDCEESCKEAFSGMVCLAICPDDRVVYRARILDVEGDNLSVLFVDCGTEGQVSLSETFVMPPELMEEPAISMLCALTGAAPLNDEGMWTESAILQFQDLVCDKIIQMRVVQPCSKNTPPGTPQLVNIVLKMKVSSRSGASSVSKPVRVSNELVRKGSAKNISLQDQTALLHASKSEGTPFDSSARLKQLKTLLAATKSSKNDNPAISNSLLNSAQLCFKRPTPLSFLNITKSSSKESATPFVFPKQNKILTDIAKTSVQLPPPSPTMEESNLLNLGNTVNKKLLHLGRMMKRKMSKAQSDDDLDHLSDDSQEASDQDESSCNAPEEMDKEYELHVMISTVVSPSCFFVHVVNAHTAHTLNALEHELKTLYEKNETANRLGFTPKKYHLCCAQFSQTKGFYRGLVVDKKSTEGKQDYLVFFIDYGDFEWLPELKIFPLPEQYISINPLVLWCTLSYVVPQRPNGTNGQGDDRIEVPASDWSWQAVKKFKDVIQGSQRLAAIATNKSLMRLNNSSHFQMEPLPVYLLDRSSPGEEICLNHLLIHQGLGDIGSNLSVSSSVNTKMECVDEDEDWDPMTADYNSIRNSYKVDTNDPGVALVGYKSGDHHSGARRVCVFYNSRSKCFKGKRCPYLHIKVDNDGLSYDQMPVLHFDQDQSDFLPRPNSLVALTVSTIISPSMFYVTLVWGRLTLDQVHHDSKALAHHTRGETLESLMDSMASFYHNSIFDGDMTTLAFGQAVVAKVKGMWMRAKVMDTDPDAVLVQVFCIDFGDLQWIHEKDVRELNLRFIHLSPQAVECCLDGVEPVENTSDWSKEAIHLFVQLAFHRNLIGLVRKRFLSGRIVLSLIDNTDDKELDIAAQLIKAGLGKAPHRSKNDDHVNGEKDESSGGKDDQELALFPA